MTEIQEMAQAIYEKHKALWPLTWAVADFMAKQLAGDQGYLIVNQLTYELMELNTQQAEQAAAQDEQEVAAVIGFYEGEREPRLLSWNVLPNGEHRLYTRPAQTEQPVNVPEGWLIELGFDVLDRPFRFVDSKSHTPTIKVILPACGPVDSSSWDLRDEIARRIGSMLATSDTDTKEA